MKDNVIVEITVSRNKDKINYKVNCAKYVKSEELAHYLDEIIEGICMWNPEVCAETMKTTVGTIQEDNKNT